MSLVFPSLPSIVRSFETLAIVSFQIYIQSHRKFYSNTHHKFNCSNFNSNWQSAEKGHVRIDISVNDAYDGSYSGNPHDLIAQPLNSGGTSGGTAFGRHGPTRRSPITAMLIWRPKRLRAAGHDALHVEGDDVYEVCETQRPFITGHNRYVIKILIGSWKASSF